MKMWNALQQIRSGQEQLLSGQAEILLQLGEIKAILTPAPAVKIVFTAVLEGSVQTGVEAMTFRDDQQVAVTIQPVDRKGKPAPVDGIPVWASSDETVVTVTAAADGMGATVAAVAPGSARVVVTADADLGEGVTPLTGILECTITGGAAVSIIITAGAPTDQKAPPPPPPPPPPPVG